MADPPRRPVVRVVSPEEAEAPRRPVGNLPYGLGTDDVELRRGDLERVTAAWQSRPRGGVGERRQHTRQGAHLAGLTAAQDDIEASRREMAARREPVAFGGSFEAAEAAQNAILERLARADARTGPQAAATIDSTGIDPIEARARSELARLLGVSSGAIEGVAAQTVGAGLARSEAAQRAAAASARGINPALAARTAQEQIYDLRGMAQGQAAELGAREQIAAQGLAAQLGSGLASAGLARATEQARLQQAMQLANQQAGLTQEQRYLGGILGLESGRVERELALGGMELEAEQSAEERALLLEGLRRQQEDADSAAAARIGGAIGGAIGTVGGAIIPGGGPATAAAGGAGGAALGSWIGEELG